ncbi:hypothetical protein MTO96_052080 [Rhipicephalus appendiculatus]
MEVSIYNGEGPQPLRRNNGRRLPTAKRPQRTYEKRNVVAARHKPGPRLHKTASALRGVTWRNTGETLGTDHCILEITIPIAESTQRAQQQQIVDWHEYRKKLEDNVTETIQDIEAWTNMLNATTKDATQTVEAEPEATMLDSRLSHLMEARNSLRRRWKRQRHNRKLRKRIAQLNRDIEHHSAVLCRQQWQAVCQEADGQLHKGKTWRLLRHLLNDQTTKGAQHYLLNKTIHKAVKEMEEAEVQRRLDAKYLPYTKKKNGESHGPHKGTRQRSAHVLRGRGEVSPPAKHVRSSSHHSRHRSTHNVGKHTVQVVHQAEEFAIALALAIPDCRTVLSDSKPAIVNFATNNVHGTTARVRSTIARPETNVTVKWFPAHAGELDAGPNRNEEADAEAHALTSRGSPSTHSSEPQRPDAEDEEYSITAYGDVLQWYRTSRRLYPPPHRDLQRSEAATLRPLQVQAIWTPVWAKHVCLEVYTTDICQHFKKARATQRHLLWDYTMKSGAVRVFFFLFCTMTVSSYKLPEQDETLDVVVDKEAERLGVEAIQVGQVLLAISNGILDATKSLDGPENQAEQYFFDKIFKAFETIGSGVVDVAKTIGSTVTDTIKAVTSFSNAKGAVTAKAADILQKIIVKDLSLYALEDGNTYKDFRQHVAQDLSRVAESLIKKGVELCSCRGRAHLDESEAMFAHVISKML